MKEQLKKSDYREELSKYFHLSTLLVVLWPIPLSAFMWDIALWKICKSRFLIKKGNVAVIETGKKENLKITAPAVISSLRKHLVINKGVVL